MNNPNDEPGQTPPNDTRRFGEPLTDAQLVKFVDSGGEGAGEADVAYMAAELLARRAGERQRNPGIRRANPGTDAGEEHG